MNYCGGIKLNSLTQNTHTHAQTRGQTVRTLPFNRIFGFDALFRQELMDEPEPQRRERRRRKHEPRSELSVTRQREA